LRRKCNYREQYDGPWQVGHCLLITGGMMDGETAVVERTDGTMASIPIRHVQFADVELTTGEIVCAAHEVE